MFAGVSAKPLANIQPVIVDISLNFMESVAKKFLSLKSIGDYSKYVWFLDKSNIT